MCEFCGKMQCFNVVLMLWNKNYEIPRTNNNKMYYNETICIHIIMQSKLFENAAEYL